MQLRAAICSISPARTGAPLSPPPPPVPPQIVRLVAEGNAEEGKFPLKMRDSAQQACFAYLREKSLLPADDSDSDDMPPNAEDFGVAW